MAATLQVDTDSLIQKIQAGDRAAFSIMYDQYSGALFGIVSKIIKEESLAEDVLQDSFIKIWKNIQKFDPTKGSFFTWMLNISRNTAIDKLRKLKNEGKYEIQNADSIVDITVGNQINQNTNQIGLKDLVNKLAPEHRLMVEYIYFNGFTHQEVSDELGIPLGTVKTRIRKALIDLRKVFVVLLTGVLFWI